MDKLLVWPQERIKLWTKPVTSSLAIGILSDLTRIRADLVVENALLRHILQPDTLLRWHQNLFRMYWRRKSQGRPKVESETIILIQKMANENLLWGAERIRGELLKLGIEVS